MIRLRGLAAAIAALLATPIAVAGCGLGPGEADRGEATLRVTHDYGAELLLEAEIPDPTESETVIKALDARSEVATRFGGGFVESIDGIGGGIEAGRSSDWFFYVNGIESDVGAAEVGVRAGDRIWWDRRDWTDAMRVPAVVGSWPEPFAQVADRGDRAPVVVACAARRAACDEVGDRLASAGAHATTETLGSADSGAPMRVLVGEWSQIRGDQAAGLLDEGPAASGVFARFEEAGGALELQALDVEAAPALELRKGAGLVAALRDGEGPPTWLVTGTDAEGVEAAAALLDEGSLRDRYAVAVERGEEPVALPAIGEEPG